MKKQAIFFLVLIVLGLAVFSFYGSRDSVDQTASDQAEKIAPLRVAWMTSWATTGQVVEALIHSDILERTNTSAEFRSFLFGPPINEAALAGDVDVAIFGDAPAISLLARSPRWSVVSRTIYFPYALMVRSDIPATSVADLEGKTVGVPFGSGPQPTLYSWLKEAGLKIGENVKIVNLLPNEMAEALKAKRVDAIMTWEPSITLMEESGAARVLKSAKGVGFMVMSDGYLAKHPKNAKNFLNAWKEALFYTVEHRTQTDEWFFKDSRLPVDLLGKLRVVDPNFSAQTLSQIDITLTEQDVKQNQAKADFMYAQGLIKEPIEIKSRLWKNN